MNNAQVLRNLREIEAYNTQNAQQPATKIVRLELVEPVLAGCALMAQLLQVPLPEEPRFDGAGHFIGADFYGDLQQQMNLIDLPGQCAAQYGMLTDNAFLRLFPTDAPSYRQRFHDELDRFSATLLKFAEPILIWHQDVRGQWLFVQNRHTWGWVKAEAVAVVDDRAQWLANVQECCFLQVTASRLMLRYDDLQRHPRQQLLLMGSKLLLYGTQGRDYVVYLPQRDEAGKLVMLPALVANDDRFAQGYLPFTSAAIVAQGLATLSEPYGWGGAHYHRDCTSLVDDVFSVFGFQLARNSTQQQAMVGVQAIAEQLNSEDRKALLTTLPVGTVLYFPGHAMIYLGIKDDNYRILHSIYQLGVPMWSELVVHDVKRVMLGHLEQHRINGQTFLESLTGYWAWENT